MITELGSSAEADIYGQFDNDRKMFIDQGWLLGETEIQLRFYKDPIHMFKVICVRIINNYELYFKPIKGGNTMGPPYIRPCFTEQ